MALVWYGDMYSSSSTPEVHGRASAGIDVLESSSCHFLCTLVLKVFYFVLFCFFFVFCFLFFVCLFVLFLFHKGSNDESAKRG